MYRIGDFFEMFFDDAKLVSRELELTLTGKDCGLEERAPMCGVPFHAVDSYVARLVSKGYKVALCDQVEDPKQAKGLVKLRENAPRSLSRTEHGRARHRRHALRDLRRGRGHYLSLRDTEMRSLPHLTDPSVPPRGDHGPRRLHDAESGAGRDDARERKKRLAALGSRQDKDGDGRETSARLHRAAADHEKGDRKAADAVEAMHGDEISEEELREYLSRSTTWSGSAGRISFRAPIPGI